MKLKLQDFYIELLKKKGPFIEEAIETPKDKLVDNIASLLNISPNKYNIKKFLEESSEEAKDLILLAEQFEFIEHLNHIRRIIISKTTISFPGGIFHCNEFGHDFAGTHKDIESIILFFLASCIDSINPRKSQDFSSWLKNKIAKENLKINSLKEFEEIETQYRKENESLIYTFQESFLQLNDELKDEWVKNYSYEKIAPDKLSNIVNEYEKFISSKKVKCADYLTKRDERLRKIARAIYKMRSGFTHSSKRFFECNCPISCRKINNGEFLILFGKTPLIDLLKDSVICLAKNKYLIMFSDSKYCISSCNKKITLRHKSLSSFYRLLIAILITIVVGITICYLANNFIRDL